MLVDELISVFNLSDLDIKSTKTIFDNQEAVLLGLRTNKRMMSLDCRIL